ncbi:hypothetical protein TorRG33x02_086020 [Trema orientale]|uniref:Uncharacterized protein n=1 Tax=Trema orientale TaxID=63057 RepID=A0A2P5FDA4_TREOI|nr:hypothetical protein TorRG33x02_086020 [Trema orientale]
MSAFTTGLTASFFPFPLTLTSFNLYWTFDASANLLALSFLLIAFLAFSINIFRDSSNDSSLVHLILQFAAMFILFLPTLTFSDP